MGKDESNFQTYIEYADRYLSNNILKEILHSTELATLKECSDSAKKISEEVKAWEADYYNKVENVQQLKVALGNYESAFNFVGLYEGFDSLQKQKVQEKKKLEKSYGNLGMVIILLIIAEFVFLNFFLKVPTIVSTISIVIPSLTLLLVLLYFLKITLVNLNSVRSQLLQIDLRMTLCRFIQKYSESSKELRNGNEKALEKFENMIFSSIVSTDEKIPSTFDGMDQIANLIKAIRLNDAIDDRSKGKS